MNIKVTYKQGSNGPITVQGGFWDNGHFNWEWCNHAGATEETSTHTNFNLYTEDIEEWDELIMVCDKCDEVVEDL